MTRIIAGSAKGRTLKVPATGTRPTSDRVRESVFNMLQHRLGTWSDLKVLDLYAGSGAYALESMSRGAHSATVVDNARHANEVLQHNAQQLGFTLRIVNRDVSKFVAQSATEKSDVVFIDPPYEVANDIITELLQTL
ncbi:MAG: rRNA ((966)-N(2))-methyltransferase RsmD, partial [Actinomycetota bacterium]